MVVGIARSRGLQKYLVKNKTPPPKQRRNEESCDGSSRVVAVPVIVEPVVVRHHLVVIPVAIPDIQVVVRRVAEMCEAPPVPLLAKRYQT